MEIGLIIKELRIKNNLTQEQLAQKAGVKRQQIQAYEKGKNFPPYKMQVLLCKIFDVDMNTLAGEASLTSNQSAKNIGGNSSQVINQGSYNKDQKIKELEKELENLRREIKDKVLIIELLQGKSTK